MRRVNLASVRFWLILATAVAALPGAARAQSALSNGGNHVAVLQVGGLDTWSFAATKNDGITVSLGKVGSGSDPIFGPWIRLQAPDGTLLTQDAEGSNSTSATVSARASLTGTYTVLVANNYSNQSAPVSYVITLSGPTSGFSAAAILVVAGSTPGNSAYFRTRVQIYNPRTSTISGKFVFHTASVSGGANDPSLSYSLTGGQTIDYPDLLPAMG